MPEEAEGRARHARIVKAEENVQACRNKEHPEAALDLICVSCMDLYPKGAVTIWLPENGNVMLSVLCNEGEIDQLYRRGHLRCQFLNHRLRTPIDLRITGLGSRRASL